MSSNCHVRPPLADHLPHFPRPQTEAEIATQLKRVRNTTCLFRQNAAHWARTELTNQRWNDGAGDSAVSYINSQHLPAKQYAINYVSAFSSDCPAVTDGSDHRAPGKLATRLEVLSKRLSPAERHALAPHLSAAALATATGMHTAGECNACSLLRQTLPSELRAAGLPSALEGTPARSASVELGAVREEDGGSSRSMRGCRSSPVHARCRHPPYGQCLVHRRLALHGRLGWCTCDPHATQGRIHSPPMPARPTALRMAGAATHEEWSLRASVLRHIVCGVSGYFVSKKSYSSQ